MNYINFIDEENNERLYDSYMLRERLRMSKSQLQKELNKYDFTNGDYILYKNQFLFKENAIVNFIESLVMKKYLLNKRRITSESLNQIRDSIKKFIRGNELQES